MTTALLVTTKLPPDDLGPNLTYALMDRIGCAIVLGRYDFIAFPTEAELAKANEVSRSVIREAVKMLTAKGLLIARPRRGISLQPCSMWDLFDTDILRWLCHRTATPGLLQQLTEIRLAIEPEAAAFGARYGNRKEIACVGQAVEEIRNTEVADIAYKSRARFHCNLLKASGNVFFIRMQGVVDAALLVSDRLSRFSQKPDYEMHAAVFKAMSLHDADRARSAMLKLITKEHRSTMLAANRYR